ncbi:hypothetical protein [Mesorhizobium sp. M0578]|uniref:hypothetical protein n=1 Tax=unclassified Mesorhizobium TaxID=325217 RepID=UPI0033368AE0
MLLEGFSRDCSIETPERVRRLSRNESSETIVVFTQDGIDNLRQIVDERTTTGDAPLKPAAGNLPTIPMVALAHGNG